MDLLFSSVLGGALQLLVAIHIVLLGELHVLQEFGVYSFHLDGQGLGFWVPVPLVGLVVIVAKEKI